VHDLMEVRRFWPKATVLDFCGPMYVARPVRWHWLTIAESFGGGWFLSDWRDGDPELCAVYRGPTIAAAMAAAGFGVRPVRSYRSCRLTVDRLKQDLGITGSLVKLQYRQRPRKGVRLGKRAGGSLWPRRW
jgi:hypothetical protein